MMSLGERQTNQAEVAVLKILKLMMSSGERQKSNQVEVAVL